MKAREACRMYVKGALNEAFSITSICLLTAANQALLRQLAEHVKALIICCEAGASVISLVHTKPAEHGEERHSLLLYLASMQRAQHVGSATHPPHATLPAAQPGPVVHCSCRPSKVGSNVCTSRV